MDPGSGLTRGAVQPLRVSWKKGWATAGEEEGAAGARAGWGCYSPNNPRAPGVAPAPHVAVAVPVPARKRRASCGWGRGYRRPRPSSPARRAMAALRAESAGGGPRLPATRAGRPTALRLLLLLGGERGIPRPGGKRERPERGGGLDSRGWNGSGLRVPTALRFGQSLAPAR